MTYEQLLKLLPYEMQSDENSTDFKKILYIYSKLTNSGDELNRKYGEVLDIYGANGYEIDFIGNMYGTFRFEEESDDLYRDRIISTLISRKTPTTLPELQQAIDSIVRTGKLYVLENYDGRVCNVYLTGDSDEESINRAYKLVNQFLPAGVYAVIPVVLFNRWQDVKDKFSTWGSLEEEGYIW